tara:strand:- start:1783 stop:2499 length:717 start_codon:yes stop_codon:yes gene_type:complete
MSWYPKLCSTRFNDETWEQNVLWREKNKDKGCIYGSPSRIKKDIDHKYPLVIIEMNNSQNKIMGLGLIHNVVFADQNRKVYDDGNFNRYIYRSQVRIDRSEFTQTEQLTIDILEKLLFYGYRHLKRSTGIQELPQYITLMKNYKLIGNKVDELDENIRIIQENPKRLGSKVYERYEKYKLAKTKKEFLSLGGTLADFNNGLNKFYIKIIENIEQPSNSIPVNFPETIYNMFTCRFNLK